MKKCLYINAFSMALVLMLVPVAFGQQVPGPDTDVNPEKRGQTGMKFLTVSLDPRASAMGGAVTASTMGSSVDLFYNPAGMARMESMLHVNFAKTQYITDFDYNAASVAFRPPGGNYGIIGLSFVNVDYGEFIGTVLSSSDPNGFIETGNYSPTALAVGVGYARSFTDRFSAGAQVKYVTQDLGTHPVSRVESGGTPLGDGTQARSQEFSESTVAVDFGVLYNTGFRSLTFAMDVRNFSPEVTYVRENFELPLTFLIGVSMDLVDLTNLNPSMHSLLFAVDAERPRDFTEHLRIGGEYTFMNIFSLRAGWAQAFVPADDTEEGISLGAGVNVEIGTIGFAADYAYTNFGIFGNLNRFGFQLSF